MGRISVCLAALITTLLISPLTLPAAPAAALDRSSAEREWWVVSGKQTTVLAEPGPAVRARLELGDNVSTIAVSPDGKLAAIASCGEMETRATWGGQTEYWPKGGARSSITLVDREGYRVTGRCEVGFRPAFVAFAQGGKTLVVVSRGQVSKDEKKNISPSIALIDIQTNAIRSQTELASPPSDFWFLDDSNRLIIACQGFQKRPNSPPELVAFDINAGKTNRTSLPSATLKFYECGTGKMRYLELESGAAVVNAEGKLVGAPVTAGKDKVFFSPGPGQTRFYLAGKTKNQGQLVVLEGGRLAKTIDCPSPEMLVFDTDGANVFLCGRKVGIVLDAMTLAEKSRFELPDAFLEVKLAPGGKQLYVNEIGDKVSVIDVESGRRIARFTTGRGGVKFVQELGVSLAQALSRVQYGMTGVPGMGALATVPRAVQSMAFSPNGKFVYVFNSQTSDITVVDTSTHTPLTKIATGPVVWGHFLWQSPGGQHLISCGGGKLLVFDADKGEMIAERQFRGVMRYEPSVGAVFVRDGSGLDVYRPAPLEKILEVGSEAALSKREMFQGAQDKSAFSPQSDRFFVASDKRVTVYGYDMKVIADIEGVSRIDRVIFLPSRAPSEARDEDQR